MEWIGKGKEREGVFKPIPGRGLYKNGAEYEWKEALVESYSAKEEKFSGKWAHNGAVFKLCRIYLMFDVSVFS